MLRIPFCTLHCGVSALATSSKRSDGLASAWATTPARRLNVWPPSSDAQSEVPTTNATVRATPPDAPTAPSADEAGFIICDRVPNANLTSSFVWPIFVPIQLGKPWQLLLHSFRQSRSPPLEAKLNPRSCDVLIVLIRVWS